jgi:hypothetical protein
MVAGLNRANWNLDYSGVVTFPNMVLWGASTSGPTVLPGAYQVRLVSGERIGGGLAAAAEEAPGAIRPTPISRNSSPSR